MSKTEKKEAVKKKAAPKQKLAPEVAAKSATLKAKAKAKKAAFK